MRQLLLLALLLCVATLGWGQTEEIEDIKAALAEAENAQERMVLRYELAEAYLKVDAKQSGDLAKQAVEAANNLNNKGMAARGAYLVAQAYERQRDDKNVEIWLRTTLNYAKQAGDSDLIIRSVDKRSQLAVKDRNYRRAYEINQEAFSYFSGKGTSITDLEAKYEALRGQIDREKRALVQTKDQLEFQVRNLRTEADQLSKEKTTLERKTEQLSESNKAKEEKLAVTEEEKSAIAAQKAEVEQEKAKVEAIAKKRALEIDNLTEEKAKEELKVVEREKALVEAELKVTNQERFVYAAAGASGILLLLAMLMYTMFSAKKRTAQSLEAKNKEIEEERKRSDELLLNILPASIAQELKATGKAKAQKYAETTVLFSDFKNFTTIAEQLSPEELVQELDTCFKAFDDIIGKYPDLEKIKTIGDAYMCAGGLSERRTMPNNMVKAALEMQEFLTQQRAVRQRVGKPFFEARIGIHTGPVVAGVVGSKKFAYDIWGDTVNTASRVEANSEPGRVNISETTYNLIKYAFHCQHRGKLEAKNKGYLDMYFVEGSV